MCQKITKEQWLERFHKKHGDKYDYSAITDIGSQVKIKVKCKKHNSYFYINTFNHYMGNGCPLCAREKMSEKMRRPQEEFVKMASKIHNNKYDYSKTVYVNNRKKVEIICPYHGSFWQRPEKHIERKQGCPHCKYSKIEDEVFNFLTGKNIDFCPQYPYDDTNKKNRLDFFIPSLNIGIECQGEQHLKPVDFANKGDEWAEALFQKNLQRDKLKKSRCDEKNIKLFYFIPPKNIVEGYKEKPIFGGIYTDDNVCNSIAQLKEKIIE